MKRRPRSRTRVPDPTMATLPACMGSGLRSATQCLLTKGAAACATSVGTGGFTLIVFPSKNTGGPFCDRQILQKSFGDGSSHPNRTHDDPDRPELAMHQSPK